MEDVRVVSAGFRGMLRFGIVSACVFECESELFIGARSLGGEWTGEETGEGRVFESLLESEFGEVIAECFVHWTR